MVLIERRKLDEKRARHIDRLRSRLVPDGEPRATGRSGVRVDDLDLGNGHVVMSRPQRFGEERRRHVGHIDGDLDHWSALEEELDLLAEEVLDLLTKLSVPRQVGIVAQDPLGDSPRLDDDRFVAR